MMFVRLKLENGRHFLNWKKGDSERDSNQRQGSALSDPQQLSLFACTARFAIPAERPLQPFLEGYRRLVAQLATRPADIGSRIAYIARACRTVLRPQLHSQQTVQGRHQV